MERNRELLEAMFRQAGVKFSFSENVLSLEDMLHESLYADLIVADARIDLAGLQPAPLDFSIKDLLADGHCPVLLLGPGRMPPDRILLCYDSSHTSLFSIRQFAYLFPSFRRRPAILLQAISGEKPDDEVRELLMDWLPLHFDDVRIEMLGGKAPDVLEAFIGSLEGHSLVVMGAYGRSAVSRLFRRSLADRVLNKTSASLFTTHE